MRDRAWRALIATTVSLGLSHGLRADDWPQFLGPHRDGISSETGLMKRWPAGGPKELWRVKGGVGMSGLSIRKERLVTLVQRGGKQRIIALDARSGKPLWETEGGPEYENDMGDGPRATPTLAGDHVFAHCGDGRLVALRLKDGEVLWRRHPVEEFGGKPAPYGMAASPLVVGELVLVTVGVTGATVVACDRLTGKTVWKSGSDRAGYSSPTWLDVGGRKQLVVFTGQAALGLDVKTGKELWRYPYATDFDCNIATPLAYEGQVFISSGENHGCALLSLEPRGAGFDVKETWTSTGPRSVLRNEWQTSILIDGHLYGFDNVGSAGPITHLNCVDISTGKRLWQKTRFGKGNFIAADGKVFMSTRKGELVVARISPGGYEELGRIKAIGPTRQAPSLSNGLLYLRDDREIVCFDVRGP